jgi:hypothetical protein
MVQHASGPKPSLTFFVCIPRALAPWRPDARFPIHVLRMTRRDQRIIPRFDPFHRTSTPGSQRIPLPVPDGLFLLPPRRPRTGRLLLLLLFVEDDLARAIVIRRTTFTTHLAARPVTPPVPRTRPYRRWRIRSGSLSCLIPSDGSCSLDTRDRQSTGMRGRSGWISPRVGHRAGSIPGSGGQHHRPPRCQRGSDRR